MSDFDTYDPYAVDDETYALIEMLAQSGYGTYPQMLNVPYTKELMGGSTDPLRQVKSQETHLKSARSLMGFDPIGSFAGPEFEPFVSQYDNVANQAYGDPYAEALLSDLDAGKGALALKQEIAASTYDPETGPEEGKKLSPQQAQAYMTWLDQAAQAQAADNADIWRREQMATEGDPYAMLPTPEAEAFDEDAYIGKLAAQGEFGRDRQTIERDVYGDGVKADSGGRRRPAMGARTRGATSRARGDTRGMSRDPVGSSVLRGQNAGYRDRERNYRALARNDVAQSYRPSPARERSLRAVMAYRMAMGLSPT